ncbi:MAG TPA: hypothetical protein VGW99_03550 [Chthoniobacterales bacterium]|jgi:hypothetical protein|nr:hypothetical protein [Chthoniobacterales bacterium]
MERFIKASAGVLLVCLSFSSCAYMTENGRQQMAYRHYVRKHVRERQRQLARIQKAERRKIKVAIKNAPPSELKTSATVESVEPVADSATFPPVTATETTPPEP